MNYVDDLLDKNYGKCPKCEQPVNGHTLVHTAQDDLNVFSLASNIYNAIKGKRVTYRPRANNHLTDPTKCPVCGQKTDKDWTKGITDFFSNL